MKRDNSIDCVATVSVTFMILGHAFLWSHTQDNEVYRRLAAVLNFFMAFFFFKSGMFWTDKKPSDVIAYGWSKFFVPFVFYAFWGEIVRCVRLYIQEGDTNLIHYFVYPIISVIGRGGPSGNVPLWFFIALFLTMLMISLAQRCKVPRLLLFCIAICLSYLGSLTNRHHINIPPVMWEVSTGILFFLLGYWMKNVLSNKIVFWLAVVFYIFSLLFLPSVYDFRKGNVTSGLWLIYVVSALSGIIVFVTFFRQSFFNRTIFGYVGRHSLQFFCLHWVLFDLISLIGGYKIIEAGEPFGNFFSKQTDWTMFCVLITGIIVIVPSYIYMLEKIKQRYNSVILDRI